MGLPQQAQTVLPQTEAWKGGEASSTGCRLIMRAYVSFQGLGSVILELDPHCRTRQKKFADDGGTLSCAGLPHSHK